MAPARGTLHCTSYMPQAIYTSTGILHGAGTSGARSKLVTAVSESENVQSPNRSREVGVRPIPRVALGDTDVHERGQRAAA